MSKTTEVNDKEIADFVVMIQSQQARERFIKIIKKDYDNSDLQIKISYVR